MSFKSKAQKEKFKELVKQGKITQAKFDEMDSKTTSKELPDRVEPRASNRATVRQTRRVIK